MCEDRKRVPPPHRTAPLLLRSSPVETGERGREVWGGGGAACGCQDHTGICTIKLCIAALSSHDKPTASQSLVQTHARKKKQTLSVQFRQLKSGSNKKGSGRTRHADSVWKQWRALAENSPAGLRSGHRHFLFLSGSSSPGKRRNCLHCGIF